jgi:hypothetical protein
MRASWRRDRLASPVFCSGRLVNGPGLEGRELAYGSGDFAFLTRKEPRSDGFPGHIIVLLIEADGRLRCEDVLPGDYALYVTAKARGQALDEADLAIARRFIAVTVPPTDRTEGAALEVGEIPVEPFSGGEPNR